jgi:UDP-3-O-[3-hydroxymyristoyl] glucosamine N-acyltransferase
MNSFPQRRLTSGHSLASLANEIEAQIVGEDRAVAGIAPLAQASADEIGLLAHRRYLQDLPGSQAGALLVSAGVDSLIRDDPRPRLVVEDAHRAMADLLELFWPRVEDVAEVHPTAVLGRGVRLGRDVAIGPYVVIEEDVAIGDEVRIGAHAVIGSASRIGSGSVLHPHVVLYPHTVLGRRVILHAGVCIGVDGFGYVEGDAGLKKVPQVGGCTLGDDVEIGANTTIDRGSIGQTRVMAGARIDNLVHLGHNVIVGSHTVLAAQVGVAGSTRIGSGVQSGGQAGINGHVSVGDGARLAAQAGVWSDVPPGSTVMGFPARPRIEYLRGLAAQEKVPELLRRVKRLEEQLEGKSERRDRLGGGPDEHDSGGDEPGGSAGAGNGDPT